MSLSVRDGITPELARMARRIKDKKPVLEAMGLQLVSFTQRAFSEPNLRPKPWGPHKRPPRKPHQLLRESGTMMKSIRVSELTNDHVKVGTDRVYAAHQQFGSAKKSGRGSGIPARPFFPFASPDSAMSVPAQEKMRKVALAKIKAILG